MARTESLYLTEARIAEKIGVSVDEWRATALVLEGQGLPKRDPLFSNRRYWPACKAFLDRRYNLGPQSGEGIPALDGEERWNNQPRTRVKLRA